MFVELETKTILLERMVELIPREYEEFTREIVLG